MYPCRLGTPHRAVSIEMLFSAVLLLASGSRANIPVPNERQLSFMEFETIQFMHFGIPTFWDPPPEYLNGSNPTYHDCSTTSIDHSSQTGGGYYPCLNPDVFNPTDLNADDWMEASAAMGMKEICITAHHEGGFALWPSNFTEYSVAASKWRDGKGDVLREFTDAANRWGIGICYYLNVAKDGYNTLVKKMTPEEFIEAQVGMVHEVLTEYGPVNRFWFDGTKGYPKGTNETELWQRVYDEIRTTSPSTMISPYRGDICEAHNGGSLYTNDGPPPNSTDISKCVDQTEGAKYFHPTEEHGITIQEGFDGNTDAMPTYWFWHPWACADAKDHPDCPWIGHANASRVFDDYLVTVGHGAVLNMNIPPERTGRMNASVAQVMRDVGRAINDTFHVSVASTPEGSIESECIEGAVVIDVPAGEKGWFDYVVTMEDLTQGQRIMNYSVEFQRPDSSDWETLIPPVWKNKPKPPAGGLGDRPDGHDPRDSHVGHKRIDFPVTNTSGPAAVAVAKVRFNCIRSIKDWKIYVRSFSLHRRNVPWEQ